ncbi:TerB family tellurite resistance protein [Paenibacillus sp. sptzw28]|uniref:TerB family tellurite resistance protein n=1 Tax=Paenibacillus sp. sptzw28 TaxID=715179 RepID=UPI001C6E8367|nr:TerB family tellurite resistance protein [Paenibacillus sp. sptzw28]QYR19180.1 TerB family tellurite resistance protein [Paenibacillus sp. sptzw28]
MFLHFLQSKEHKLKFLKLANFVASTDGFVNWKERGYIRSFVNEMDLQETDMLYSPKSDLSEIIGDLKDQQVKNIFFAEILLLIFVDGDYNDDEKQIVKDIKQLFGFSDATYETFRNWVIRMDKLKIEGMSLILDPS